MVKYVYIFRLCMSLCICLLTMRSAEDLFSDCFKVVFFSDIGPLLDDGLKRGTPKALKGLPRREFALYIVQVNNGLSGPGHCLFPKQYIM